MGLLELQTIRENRGKPKEAKRYSIPKKSAKKIAQDKAIKETGKLMEDTELQKWYAKIMQDEQGKCWETGVTINKQDKLGWHGSIAHILDKANYPSVKTHPLNYMILSMWGGTHGQYDSSWEHASKMKVWSYAIKIINLLYPLLKPEEKRRLPDVIIQEINPEIYNSKK